MSRLALVLNSGSSSIKLQLVDPLRHAEDDPYAAVLVERIGEPNGAIIVKFDGEKHTKELPIADHSDGLEKCFAFMDELGCGASSVDIAAVGHRVVHGGIVFSRPELISEEMLEEVRKLSPLAPLHNPANIAGIEVAQQLLPDVPHVAVFDTGFFHTMPPAAAIYAIDRDVAAEYGIRRYGFHGTSHEYVSKKSAEVLNVDLRRLNQVTIHLGNGASMAAIAGGHAIDTTMGMSPIAGLIMGTRSGDVDPGILIHLQRTAGMSVDDIDNLLNRRAGLKGLAGENDFRALQEMIDNGDEDAWVAYNVYVHQIRKYLGSFMVALTRLDSITFTGGIGENHVGIRRDVCADLAHYGIEIDEQANAQRTDGARQISTPNSRVKVLVVPTNEELAIARYAMSFV